MEPENSTCSVDRSFEIESATVPKKADVPEPLEKVQDNNELDECDVPVEVTTQGIFAHSTSLEDSITDDIQNLDLLNLGANSGREGSVPGDSVMKSSIHELQGDDPVLSQIKTDTVQSTPDKVASGER